MTTTEKIMVANGTVTGLLLVTSASIALRAYLWNDRKTKTDRALALYQSLMTTEFLLKARLICQEYLLEDPRSKHYETFAKKNFEVLDIEMRLSADKEVRADRLYIRAIPNFSGR